MESCIPSSRSCSQALAVSCSQQLAASCSQLPAGSSSQLLVAPTQSPAAPCNRSQPPAVSGSPLPSPAVSRALLRLSLIHI
eukprot:6268034-Alexandrium_andersonii.AAC.1